MKSGFPADHTYARVYWKTVAKAGDYVPKVSVIVPIYNVADYLDECVASVCEQTFRDMEIILVDDGSTDACPAMCDRWAEKDERIKVIHKPNGGLSDARNAGLDAAAGEYVQFVDADDYVDRELLSTVVPHMDQGCDMVAFRFIFSTFLNNDPEWVCNFPVCDIELASGRDRLNFFFSMLLQGGIGWEAWSRIYRKSVIDETGLRFADNKRIFAEDLYFCLCYCMRVGRIKSLPFVLYYYRKRGDSIMSLAKNSVNMNKMNQLGKEVLSYAERIGFTELDEYYPVMHFFIMNNVVERMLTKEGATLQEIKKAVQGIEDLAFFKKNVRRLQKLSSLLISIYNDRQQATEWIAIYRYLAGGTFLMYYLRIVHINKAINIIRSRVPFLLNRYQSSLTDFKEWQYERFSHNDKRIFVLGTEDFDKVGGYDIAESIIRFLVSTHPDHSVFEVCAGKYQTEKEKLLRYVQTDDLIVMTGGENFGDIYPDTHKTREDVVRTFPKNKKVVFPQSIVYTDTEAGREMLELDRGLFTAENNVTLFCMEKESYDFAKANFTCKVGMVPDIVLYFAEKTFAVRREGISLCLRSDTEKELSFEDEKKLADALERTGYEFERIDLQLDHHVPQSARVTVIHHKIQRFTASKLIITDRLHGMIFAAVTGTPCIALSNTNHKIKGSFEWLRDLGYIKFVSTVEEAEALIPELMELEDCRYDPDSFRPFFRPLEDEISANL